MLEKTFVGWLYINLRFKITSTSYCFHSQEDCEVYRWMTALTEKHAGKMVSFYHRFIDDNTIATQRDLASADAFLSTLNSCRPFHNGSGG